MTSDPASGALQIRPLTGGGEDLDDLQRVFEGAPDYALRVCGRPPLPADAECTFTILPEDKTFDDKFVFGIFLDGRMVGCIDVMRGWPVDGIAMVGLMLVAEAYQRKGVGRRAYEALEEVLRGWKGCRRVRIGVVLTNAQVLRFWEKMGFRPTGERKPYEFGDIVSETVILEKLLERRD